jgi:hypothetical protein
MPNSNLPAEIKDITSFKVLVTQHTEEDVDMMLAKKYIDYLDLKNELLNIASNELGKMIDSNPYIDYDFKTPLEDSRLPWLIGKSEQYMKICHLRNDFARCSKIFKKEYSQLDDLDFFVNQMITYGTDYQFYEKGYRSAAYKHWMNKKKLIKDTDKLKNPHKYHISIQDWELKIASDPDCVLMLDGPEKYAESKSCSLCIADEEERIKRMINRDFIPAHILEQEKIEDYKECEDCGFLGKSYKFEAHLNQSQHLMALNVRSLYCEKCETQCRSEKELQIHNKSAKHIKINNEKESIEYKCEKCNYSTVHKHVYETHCKSKRHNN